MTVKFRQPIRPGDSGRDVRAVKRTLLRLHVPDSGAMGATPFAGAAFVHVLRTFQRHHGLHGDGVYGRSTHAKLATHFLAYDRWLYRHAKIRKPSPPPVPNLSAQAAAKKILASGHWHPDNPGDLPQMQAAAEGRPVWSPGGYWVHIDRRVLDAILWLIERGHHVGTFAICSDHHYDSPLGHAGGFAVDISSFDGVSVASGAARAKTLELATLLHSAPGYLRPWQLICGGYGYQYDSEIERETIPSAAFYGAATMAQHRNHVHLGYLR